LRVAFVLRELRKRGRCRFDAEGVIEQSSPYKGTAERSSAPKKPHKKKKSAKSLADFNLKDNLCSKFSRT